MQDQPRFLLDMVARRINNRVLECTFYPVIFSCVSGSPVAELFSAPKVAVLLATYNGAAGLPAQLQSYVGQSVSPALVLVSDDGSKDETRQILTRFAKDNPQIEVQLLEGPRLGAAQNFLSLLRHVPDWIDVVSLSDQDDVWLPDKIRRGLRALADPPDQGQCLLYCGRTWECDAELGHKRISRGMRRPATFRHALVQNLAGGNTMMLNRPALDLLQAASHEARKLVVHDWWIYQVITGAGGQVIFDNAPLLYYRQHGGNMIGANRGFGAKTKRLSMVLSGRFRRWNTVNIKALSASAHRFTPENQMILRSFSEGRNRSVWRRLVMIWHTGLYRQGLQGNLSLYFAALLRRI